MTYNLSAKTTYLILLGTVLLLCLFPPMEILYQFSGKGPPEFIQHRFLFADATWQEGADEYRATVAVGRFLVYLVMIACIGALPIAVTRDE